MGSACHLVSRLSPSPLSIDAVPDTLVVTLLRCRVERKRFAMSIAIPKSPAADAAAQRVPPYSWYALAILTAV